MKPSKIPYKINSSKPPSQKLIKDPYSPTIYLLLDNKKCGFPDTQSYQRFDCVSAYETGTPIDTNAQLIKGKDSNKVYFVQYGCKRWIASQDVFFKMGFCWDKILVVQHVMLQLYQDGPMIS